MEEATGGGTLIENEKWLMGNKSPIALLLHFNKSSSQSSVS